MSESIRKQLTFPQPPVEVWRALTDSATVAEWMYPNDIEARVGHRFTFRVPPNPDAKFDGVVRGEVLVCDRPTEFAYRWVAGGYGQEVDTRVSYRLEPDGAGTRVLFEHTGFELEPTRKGAAYGWALMHDKLADALTASSSS